MTRDQRITRWANIAGPVIGAALILLAQTGILNPWIERLVR